MACRLAALDEEPGVRPVGIGEVDRRLMAKIVVAETGSSATISCGSANPCAGPTAGIKGALHAMVEAPHFLQRQRQEAEVPTTGGPMLDDSMEPITQAETSPQSDDSREGTVVPPPEPAQHNEDENPHVSIVLDPRNGFNELGRKAKFWMVRHRWATGCRFAFNCYRHQCQLILRPRGAMCYTILLRRE